MIVTLAVENYRSLRRFVVPLTALTAVTGANGTGKSSLYRSLRLLADAAHNGAVAALAREGGLPSTLWAGPETVGRAVREGVYPVQGTRRTKSVSLRLGFGGDDFGYAIDFGLPSIDAAESAFALDPEIKRESIWSGPVLRPSAVLCERDNGIVRARGDGRTWSGPYQIRPFDSMLSEFADPGQAPEVLRVREQVRSWRFYDHVRTDAAAPSRASHIGTRTPVMSHDGADVAAALQTIRETGADALDQAIELAFPGSRLTVESEGGGRLGLRLHQHGLLRPLSAAELSDGTLRYLLWAAALLAPRPAGLLVLNEPETSLHPQLLAPLAQLITTAAESSQVIVVSHSHLLLNALHHATQEAGIPGSAIELIKDFGETRVAGREPFDEPAWRWPKR